MSVHLVGLHDLSMHKIVGVFGLLAVMLDVQYESI